MKKGHFSCTAFSKSLSSQGLKVKMIEVMTKAEGRNETSKGKKVFGHTAGPMPEALHVGRDKGADKGRHQHGSVVLCIFHITSIL